MVLRLRGMGDDGYWEGSVMEACIMVGRSNR